MMSVPFIYEKKRRTTTDICVRKQIKKHTFKHQLLSLRNYIKHGNNKRTQTK